MQLDMQQEITQLMCFAIKYGHQIMLLMQNTFFNNREIYKSYIVLPISENVITLWVYLECGTMYCKCIT